MSSTVNTAQVINDEETQMKDALENLVASLGSEADKRTHSKFQNRDPISAAENRAELEAMYRTDWFTGKLVDIIPEDMTRKWRRFNSDDLTPEQIEELEDEELRLRVREHVHDAHKWGRLYGGAIILLVIDDGLEPNQPFDIKRMKEGSLRHMKVLDRHFVSPSQTLVLDPMDPDFGLPRTYRLAESSVEVHHTRVIRFDGLPLPLEAMRRNNYWGDSIVARVHNTIINANTALDASASMIYDTNVDVIKVKGLMNYLASPEGTKQIQRRFALDGFLKSFINAHIMDAEESYERSSNTFSGLPDLIDRYLAVYAAAGDVPATRMLSKSPDGMNATGDGDLNNYYDKINSDQELQYRPKLAKIDELMARNLGWDVKPRVLKFKFEPLRQLTEQEEASLEKTRAERDAYYWDREIVPSSAIAKDLKQRGVYENITDEHIKYLEQIETEEYDRDEPSPTDEPDAGGNGPGELEEEAEEEEEQEGASGTGTA